MGDTKVAAGSGSFHHVAEVEAAKRVLIYTNGDKYFAGRNFVVNPRQLRDFDSFLNEVTQTLRPTFGAVRAIRTPRAGHKVPNLTLLENGKSYVAAGGGKFVKIGYDEISSLIQKSKEAGHSPREFVSRRKLQVSGRVRKIKLEPVEIMVYTNGETMEPARRLLIKPWIDRDWESVLAAIDEKVQLRNGAVRKLIEMSTKQEVKEIKSLKSHQYYVAVGAEKFKDLEYGQSEASQSPRQLQKRRYPQLPPLKKKSSTNENGSEATDTLASPDNGSQNAKADGEPAPTQKSKEATADDHQANATAPGQKDTSAQEQPPPNKKPAPTAAAGAASKRPPPAAAKEPVAKEPAAKEPAAKEPAAKEPAAKEPAAKEPAAKEPAAKAQKAPKDETVVPLKPLKHKRSGGREKKELKEAASGPAPVQEAKNVDLDRDEGGIYKAKLKDSDGVEEVSEDKHTKQEVPVDHRDAEEIVEEEQAPPRVADVAPDSDSKRQLEPSPPPSPPPESKPSSRRSPRGSRHRSDAGRATPIGEPSTTQDRTATPPGDEESAGHDGVPPTPQEERSSEAVRADTPPTKYVKEEQAAVKIQAAYRGYSTRTKLRKDRAESDEAATAEAAAEAAADDPLTRPSTGRPESTHDSAGASAAPSKDDVERN